MSNFLIPVIAALIVFAYAVCEAAPDGFLPDTICGWNAAGPIAHYDSSNIFDYMDGAGELYLAFGFRDLAVREYAAPSGLKMTAEVYQLADSKEAFGVYTAERGAKPTTDKTAKLIGHARDFEAGMLRFWKAEYFVRIVADKDVHESRAAILALGRSIAEQIRGDGVYPSILRLLPRRGLVLTSVRFFHKHTVLNYHYYLSDANLLNLSEKTSAVLAQYKVGVNKPRLLVARYPSSSEARAAYMQFVKVYLREQPKPNEFTRVEKAEPGKHIGIRVKGALLRLVFEAGTVKQAREMLETR